MIDIKIMVHLGHHLVISPMQVIAEIIIQSHKRSHKKAAQTNAQLFVLYFAGLSQRGLCLYNNGCEGIRLVHCKVGENLAVHFNPGQIQTIDKARIRQRLIMGAYRRIDPLNPQSAEVALAVMTIAGRILIGLIDRLCSNLEGVLATAIIAFRRSGYFL